MELSSLQHKSLSSAPREVGSRAALWEEWGFSPTPFVSLSLDKKKMELVVTVVLRVTWYQLLILFEKSSDLTVGSLPIKRETSPHKSIMQTKYLPIV